VKKYVVTLSADDRERLNALIQRGKAPGRQALKARILLKADASEAGEAWSDGQIAEALDTSIDTVARTRQLPVEGGIDAALTRKQSARDDYECERNGTFNLFMLFAPLDGWRHVELTDRHAALDYAQVLEDLSDRHFSGASKMSDSGYSYVSSYRRE
jgi:hypothetical protein